MASFRRGRLRAALRYPARLVLSVGIGAGVPLLLVTLTNAHEGIAGAPALLALLACAALLAVTIERFVLRAPLPRAALPSEAEAIHRVAVSRNPLAVFRDMSADAVDRTYVELRDLRSRTRAASTASLHPPR